MVVDHPVLVNDIKEPDQPQLQQLGEADECTRGRLGCLNIRGCTRSTIARRNPVRAEVVTWRAGRGVGATRRHAERRVACLTRLARLSCQPRCSNAHLQTEAPRRAFCLQYRDEGRRQYQRIWVQHADLSGSQEMWRRASQRNTTFDSLQGA